MFRLFIIFGLGQHLCKNKRFPEETDGTTLRYAVHFKRKLVFVQFCFHKATFNLNYTLFFIIVYPLCSEKTQKKDQRNEYYMYQFAFKLIHMSKHSFCLILKLDSYFFSEPNSMATGWEGGAQHKDKSLASPADSNAESSLV